jgi:hypothetical protein
MFAYLMAELIITTLKFIIRNPNRQAILLDKHAGIDIPSNSLSEIVGARSECANPKFLLEFIPDTLHSVLQTTVTARTAFKMPRLSPRFRGRVA